MSLKQTGTLTVRNTGGKDKLSDLEMKMDGLDTGEWERKRSGKRYQDNLPRISEI